MSLATQIAADTAAILSTDEFGETVSYTPAGGSPKSIVGWVQRHAISPDGQLRGVPLQHPELWILRDATSGVATPKPTDTVTLLATPGGSSVTYRVASVIPTSDSALWHLRLVK